jgi:hypothetical protein
VSDGLGQEVLTGPGLVVHSPRGTTSTVLLRGTAATIGRPTPEHRPDVALEPDPQQWVGRAHCSLHLRGGVWTIRDGSTVNGTLLRRGREFRRLEHDARLRHGDEILILGDVAESGRPMYWRLVFCDPHATRTAPAVHPVPATGSTPPSVQYDFSSARIYRHADGGRVEVEGLRPKAHELVRHMVARAEELGTSAVLCTHQELLRALFGPPERWRHDRAYTEQDIRDVVSDARKALEPDRSHPVILQTVRGQGYRLVAWTPPGSPA